MKPTIPEYYVTNIHGVDAADAIEILAFSNHFGICPAWFISIPIWFNEAEGNWVRRLKPSEQVRWPPDLVTPQDGQWAVATAMPEAMFVGGAANILESVKANSHIRLWMIEESRCCARTGGYENQQSYEQEMSLHFSAISQ